jgi:hypothetical protein
MLSVPITTDVLSSNLDQGEVKFVSDLRQVVRWFSPGPLDSSTIKTDRHNIAEILLKVALNNIKQTIKIYWFPVLVVSTSKNVNLTFIARAHLIVIH